MQDTQTQELTVEEILTIAFARVDKIAKEKPVQHIINEQKAWEDFWKLLNAHFPNRFNTEPKRMNLKSEMQKICIQGFINSGATASQASIYTNTYLGTPEMLTIVFNDFAQANGLAVQPVQSAQEEQVATEKITKEAKSSELSEEEKRELEEMAALSKDPHTEAFIEEQKAKGEMPQDPPESQEIQKLREQIQIVVDQKNEAVNNQNYDVAAEMREKEIYLNNLLLKAQTTEQEIELKKEVKLVEPESDKLPDGSFDDSHEFIGKIVTLNSDNQKLRQLNIRKNKTVGKIVSDLGKGRYEIEFSDENGKTILFYNTGIKNLTFKPLNENTDG